MMILILMFQIKELLYPNLRLFEKRYESLISKRNSVKKSISGLIEQYNFNKKTSFSLNSHKIEQASTDLL